MTEYNSSRKGKINPDVAISTSAYRKRNGMGSKTDFFEKGPEMSEEEQEKRTNNRLSKIEKQLFDSAINDCLNGKQPMYILDSEKNYRGKIVKAGTVMQFNGQIYVVEVNKKYQIFLKNNNGEKITVNFNKYGEKAEPIELNSELEITLKNLIKN